MAGINASLVKLMAVESVTSLRTCDKTIKLWEATIGGLLQGARSQPWHLCRTVSGLGQIPMISVSGCEMFS